MDAVTYPDARVIEFVSAHLIPLRVPYNHEPIARDFKVQWTPTLVTLDEEGNEHHRTVGWLAPEELVPSLLLGMGKSHFDRGNFAEAIATFEKVVKEFPKSGAAPEAVYHRGVAGFKATHTAQPLKDALAALKEKYPENEWTRRAAPYGLL